MPTPASVPVGHPSDSVAYLDAATLASAFRRGELSPVEVAALLVDRIEAIDPRINAIVHVDRTATLAQAEAAAVRIRAGRPLSPLDGVPATIKDLSHVKGWPRRRGSLTLRDVGPSAEDTPCVARLREAGVVFLAKTTTPEGGCKVVTSSPLTGVTTNPWDVDRTPGGSSGGAAAALACGIGPLAVGSDGAGSIRIPAASTNVFGIKPGFGRVPAFPPDIDMPMSVVGPMTRTVADAALMLDVMSRPEPRDPYAWPVPFVAPTDLADPDLRDLRIAVSARLGCVAPLVDLRVDALVAEAGPLLAEAGARVEAVDPVWPVDPFVPFRIFWETACTAAIDATAPEKRDLVEPLIRRVAEDGRRHGLSDYLRALEQRMALAAASKAFFERFDLLVGPVMPVPPYAADRDTPEGHPPEDWSWCPYTHPWNMTGQPAASVPIGFVGGLPVGVQIVGRVGGEATVLRAAAAIEARRPLHRLRPGTAV
jgi:aspartyl-tRNA(Asn)/glutamyl-tRNA(Gln) amidotransferase subunit A